MFQVFKVYKDQKEIKERLVSKLNQCRSQVVYIPGKKSNLFGQGFDLSLLRGIQENPSHRSHQSAIYLISYYRNLARSNLAF